MSGVPVLSIGGDDVLSIGGDDVLAIGGETPPPPPGNGPTVPYYALLQPADFEAAIAERLLPRGLAWTRVVGSVLQGFWRAVAGAVWAVHNRAGALTEIEGFPPTALELLPEWEAVFGLPDPCLGQFPTTAARQAEVAERLAATGGQSIAYFTQLAALLGATIRVTEYAPFRFGIDSFGEPLRNQSWAYAWLVTVAGTTLQWFTWGVSSWSQPFWSVPGGAVVCELQRLAPAHTILFFSAASGVNNTVGAVGPFLADYSLTDSSAYAT